MVTYIMNYDIFFLSLSVFMYLLIDYLSDFLHFSLSFSLSLEHKFLCFTFFPETGKHCPSW